VEVPTQDGTLALSGVPLTRADYARLALP